MFDYMLSIFLTDRTNLLAIDLTTNLFALELPPLAKIMLTHHVL